MSGTGTMEKYDPLGKSREELSEVSGNRQHKPKWKGEASFEELFTLDLSAGMSARHVPG